MVIEKGTDRHAGRQDIVHIIILLAIALGIGTYLIITTTLIAKDGVAYINYAKRLAIDPLGIIRDCSEYAPRHYTPGYPFLILMTHHIIEWVGDGSTVQSWVYASQMVTLLCRILALILLYFIGKEFVGSKSAFWSILILIMLPYPAKLGSDALRDWPHMLFLAAGFLILLRAAIHKKRLMFTFVGIVSGLGYTIRPMCAQLMVYGVLWLLFSICRQGCQSKTSRAKLIRGLALLLVGFGVVVVPYMKIKGEIMPDRLHKMIESLSMQTDSIEANQQNTSVYTAGFVPGDIAKAFVKLISRVSENLMYFFLPPLFIGLFYYFHRKLKDEPLFFITAFISLNVIILIFRNYRIEPALSHRYVLPLTAFTVFFIPAGLQITGRYFARSEEQGRQLFFGMLVFGLILCLPKLVRPIRAEKQTYRLAAEWLKNNTNTEEVIAVFDPRVSFYGERKGKVIYHNHINDKATYVVKTTKDQWEEPANMTKVWSSSLSKNEKTTKIVIYERN